MTDLARPSPPRPLTSRYVAALAVAPEMSALNSDTVPAQDAAPGIDSQQQQLQQLQQQQQQQQEIHAQSVQSTPSNSNESARKRPYFTCKLSSRSHRALILFLSSQSTVRP